GPTDCPWHWSAGRPGSPRRLLPCSASRAPGAGRGTPVARAVACTLAAARAGWALAARRVGLLALSRCAGALWRARGARSPPSLALSSSGCGGRKGCSPSEPANKEPGDVEFLQECAGRTRRPDRPGDIGRSCFCRISVVAGCLSLESGRQVSVLCLCGHRPG